jgi:hypothetical protein
MGTFDFGGKHGNLNALGNLVIFVLLFLSLVSG